MPTDALTAKIQNARSLSKQNPEAEHLPYQNIGELLFKQARNYDTKPYLVFYDIEGNRIEYGYKDFFMLVQQCANMMQDFGIRKGDRIVTISHNHADTVIHYYASWLLGACVVPVSLSEDDSRIEYIVKNSRAKLAFLRIDYAGRILPILRSIESLETVLLTGERSEEFADESYFDEELERSAVIFTSPDAVRQEDEALIVYTSGTTGNPKGVVLTQRNLMLDAKGISEWHGLTNSQKMMCVLPIHHVNGTIVTIVTSMYFGGTLVLNQRFQSETFLPRIAEEKVNVVSVVPTLLAFLIEHYKSDPSKIPATPTLRHIICGAGPLTVELGVQFEDMFNLRILHGYGLSETTCYSCFLPIDLTREEHQHWMRDYGFPSIGVAIPQNEMMIADENGNELQPDDRGEIAIRGVNVMKYYYENEEANEKTFSYGWFRSGDEGFYRKDHLGRKFFFITGRLKELIIRGGVNISPLEIDEVLSRCPNVKAAIAVGFENDFYGEEVGAYVQPHEGVTLTEEDVVNFCKEHLPHNKVPKVVVFGNDIPVTSTGKYQRNKCKPHFTQWKSAQFRKS